MILGVIAVVALVAVVVGKYLTQVRIQQLRQKVTEKEVSARTVRGKLKQVETQSGVAGREVKAKERKKVTLEKQIAKYKKELAP